MSAKAEIGWSRTTSEGVKIDVYARHVGKKWKIFWRERRFDQWQEYKAPPMEDWLELLDSVDRRIARLLLRPEEAPTLRKHIKELFPEADV